MSTRLAGQQQLIPSGTKGFPVESYGLELASVAQQRWSVVRDFETPIAVVDRGAAVSNASLFSQWAERAGVELFPHAKTVMSPQLLRMQSDNGAAGFTVASPAQALRVMGWGARDVLVASIPVHSGTTEAMLGRAAEDGVKVSCFVDSVDSVELLESAARRTGTVVEVLLELGQVGGRTGVRTAEHIAEVQTAIARKSRVRLIGVAGFEGTYGADRTPSSIASVESYLAGLVRVLAELVASGAIETDIPVLSAGGTMYFDLVEEARHALALPHRLIVRSGCALLFDHSFYGRWPAMRSSEAIVDLRPALTVWSSVISRPESTRAILDVGRRDVGTDHGLPVPLRRSARGNPDIELVDEYTTVRINDQHLHIEIPADDDLRVGDRIEFGIGHPCTTMDKWALLPIVNDDLEAVEIATTHF